MPLCSRRRRIGAHEQQEPVGEVRLARPHLLPAHHPVVAVALGAAAQRRQVGAGVRLREAEAPHLVARAGCAAGSVAAARGSPAWIRTEPTMLTATASRISGARARAISSVKMICSFSDAPRPPCSRGHWMPTQPPPASSRCQARWKSRRVVLVVGRRGAREVFARARRAARAESLLLGRVAQAEHACARLPEARRRQQGDAPPCGSRAARRELGVTRRCCADEPARVAQGGRGATRARVVVTATGRSRARRARQAASRSTAASRRRP